jgi:hypothetical protein
MRSITIYILIFVTCCFLLLLNKQKVEHLENTIPLPSSSSDGSVPDDKQEKSNQQKIRGATSFIGNNRTQQLDELYENTLTFNNEEGREGLDICLEKCRGNCVEFGMHGKAFCFNVDK